MPRYFSHRGNAPVPIVVKPMERASSQAFLSLVLCVLFWVGGGVPSVKDTLFHVMVLSRMSAPSHVFSLAWASESSESSRVSWLCCSSTVPVSDLDLGSDRGGSASQRVRCRVRIRVGGVASRGLLYREMERGTPSGTPRAVSPAPSALARRYPLSEKSVSNFGIWCLTLFRSPSSPVA